MRLTYSINEVADMLGKSRTAVYDLMRRGQLFYIQPGGHRLIPAKSLEAFLDGKVYDPNEGKRPEQHADTSTWPPTDSILNEGEAA